MLYMAMFVLNLQWLQLHTFILLSLIAVTHTSTVRPFESTLVNFLNIFNELIGLIAGYLILHLQDMRYPPEQLYDMAYFVVYTFYFSAAVNLLVIFGVTTRSTIYKLKKLFRRCKHHSVKITPEIANMT